MGRIEWAGLSGQAPFSFNVRPGVGVGLNAGGGVGGGSRRKGGAPRGGQHERNAASTSSREIDDRERPRAGSYFTILSIYF